MSGARINARRLAARPDRTWPQGRRRERAVAGRNSAYARTVDSPGPAEEMRNALRAEGRARRRAVAGAERSVAEERLVGHLGSLALAANACVGVYVSDDGEPSLDALVSVLRGRGHRVALPVPTAGSDDFTMEFRPWLEADELVAGRFGIPCPPARASIVPGVVLVPLVRFDATGNRMGRGAGFYDRWLSRHDANAIGTAFECQRAGALEAQPHDVAMQAIVTELGIRFIRPTGMP